MATERVGLYHDRRKKKPWIVRWFGEYDPVKEKERRYSKSFRLKRDAEAFQVSKQSELEGGGLRDRPAELTVSEFKDKYLKAS